MVPRVRQGRDPRGQRAPVLSRCWGGITRAPPVPQQTLSCPGGAFTRTVVQWLQPCVSSYPTLASTAGSRESPWTCIPLTHTDPSSPDPPASPSHLRAERCLLVEVAVHELAVLPRRDLAAGHRAGSGLARGRARSPLRASPRASRNHRASHPQGPTASLPLPGTAQNTDGAPKGAWSRSQPRCPQLTCPWCRCSRAGP